MTWEDNVRKTAPYTAGEQPRKAHMIKLNTNECPYGPAPGVARAAARLDTADLRLYPDPDSTLLVEALAEYYHVRPEQIFVGVGSDDVLALSFLTFFHSDRPILFPDVTYSFYDVWAGLYGIDYRLCPLDENWHIRAEDYRQPNGGIIFPNPNAPTGLAESLNTVREILDANRDSVVIVDEAYVDFGGESALKLLDEYDNLLVVRTFSKSRSLAGLRIGFALGNERMIRYLKDVKFSFNSYTMNLPSLVLGTASLKDDEYFHDTVGKIIRTRERVKEELKELGFHFPDSSANFIFAGHSRVSGRALFEALRAEDIYVRYWDKPRIGNYLRITIGTDEKMDSLIRFLRQYPGIGR